MTTHSWLRTFLFGVIELVPLEQTAHTGVRHGSLPEQDRAGALHDRVDDAGSALMQSEVEVAEPEHVVIPLGDVCRA